MCGDRVIDRNSLPYEGFRMLMDIQKAGRMDPATVPLCEICIVRVDPPPQAPPWRPRRSRRRG